MCRDAICTINDQQDPEDAWLAPEKKPGKDVPWFWKYRFTVASLYGPALCIASDNEEGIFSLSVKTTMKIKQHPGTNQWNGPS